MVNFVTGAIGVLLASGFLLVYLVKLSALPLTVIILMVIVMMCIDFFQSVRSDSNQRD